MIRLISTLFALLATVVAQSPMTPIQAVSLKRVSGPIVSPDGKLVAFFRTEARLAEDKPGGHFRHLCVIPANGKPGDERVLLGGKRVVSGAAFSPDGTSITYLDARGTPHREVYALPLNGGEPVRVTESKHGVSSYKWSPDRSMIAYVARDPIPAPRAAGRRLGFGQEMFEEDWTHLSLWVWDVAKRTPRRLTSGRTVLSYEWSRDGSRIAIGSAPRNVVDDTYMFVRLWSVDLEADRVTKLVENPGKLGAFAWSPDGKTLAYISAENPRDPHAGMLYFLDTSSGKVTPYDNGFAGMFHTVEWSGDKVVRGVLSKGVITCAYEISPGLYTKVTELPVACRALTTGTGGVAFGAGSTGSHPDELFRFEGKAATRMTDSNSWLGAVALGKQTVERVKMSDGAEVEGLLIHPIGAAENRPLVIVAHGGPESHFSNGWLTSYSQWGQILAGRGYYVWYPNYRASTGYGVRYAMADHGDPMGREFEDHIDAVAYFAKAGLVDSKRVGLGGGSYGGYTAAWAATRHSKHFAAAVSFVPFVDIRTKWLTSDIPWEFYYVHYEERWPWQQQAFLGERSPLTFATDCRTPLLLLGGTADPRVHPSQPHMLYRAVKMGTTTPIRYIRYPGEGHGNRINTNRYDYLIRTLRWFEHYLRPGDHRMTPPPGVDLDYSSWAATGK